MTVGALASVLAGGCQIEDPAQQDVNRLLDALCEQADTCRCAGTQDMNACEVRRSTWDERLAEGRRLGLVFDAACLETIQARVQTHGCLDATTEDGHLCENFCAVFHGTVERGEDCEGHDALTSTCAQGLTCLDGTCVEPCDRLGGLAEGAPCLDDDGNTFDDCAENLICDVELRRCAALPDVGSPCVNGECGRDAWCDWETGVCRDAAGVGESCQNAECVDSAFCDWSTDTGVCRQAQAEGQPCRELQCADGLRCDWTANRCRPPGEQGERCDDVGCVEGLFCGRSGRCVPPGEAGEACEGNTCRDGLWCDWDLGQCAPLPNGEGQPCPIGECGGRLWCDTSNDPEGECRLRAPFGDPCTGHRQCESGFCPAGFCVELPLEGESCANANACANGLVCDGEVCIPALNRGSAVCSFAGW